jgi:hypothetical protein
LAQEGYKSVILPKETTAKHHLSLHIQQAEVVAVVVLPQPDH